MGMPKEIRQIRKRINRQVEYSLYIDSKSERSSTRGQNRNLVKYQFGRGLHELIKTTSLVLYMNDALIYSWVPYSNCFNIMKYHLLSSTGSSVRRSRCYRGSWLIVMHHMSEAAVGAKVAAGHKMKHKGDMSSAGERREDCQRCPTL